MTAARAVHPAGNHRFAARGVLTGIGSLPFASPADAVSFVEAHSPDLPFCPQPPVGDDLAAAVAAQVRELGQAGGRQRRWFHAFHYAITRGAFPRARGFKTQVTGPLTLAQFCSTGGRPTHEDPAALAALTTQVAEWAVWQVRQLRPPGQPVLVYVDEPALGALPAAAVPAAIELLAPIFAAIEASGGVAGLHCCVGVSPARLAASAAAVISFDACSPPASLAEEVAVLTGLSRTISFGLASTVHDHHDPFTDWLAYATEVEDPVDLARRTIVTPTCGLGAADGATAEAAFRRAADASKAITKVAGTGDERRRADATRGRDHVVDRGLL